MLFKYSELGDCGSDMEIDNVKIVPSSYSIGVLDGWPCYGFTPFVVLSLIGIFNKSHTTIYYFIYQRTVQVFF